MTKRINISLPDDTIDLIDRVAKRGDRSSLIDRAVRHYVESVGERNLHRQLKEGALRHAERDLAIASEWFSVEDEAWSDKRR